MTRRKAIAIIGPTASGKTGIGVRLAKELNGEIISADSRQVYRGLNLGTGKEYFKDVPQHLIDIVEPGTRFTLFNWLPLARLAIEDIFSRGKVPIIVGGTGLYVQALIEGFELETRNKCVISTSRRVGTRNLQNSDDYHGDPSSHTTLAGDDTKKELQQFNNLTIEQLRSRLKEIDPTAYQTIDLSNPHRLIRAIERAREGLKPVKKKPDFNVLQIAIDLPREELYKRIDERVEQRFDQGMIEEVIALLSDGVDPQWLIKLGLEYKIITQFILNSGLSPVSLREKFPSFVISSGEALESRNLLGDVGLSKDPSTALRSGLPAAAKLWQAGRDDKQKNAQDDSETIFVNQLKSLPEYKAMKQELKYKIHAFARRQLTWFRRFPEINWLGDYDEIKILSKEFLREY